MTIARISRRDLAIAMTASGAIPPAAGMAAAAASGPEPAGVTYPRTIAWSGFTWSVKESGNSAVGPGGNRFSAATRAVRVDAAGVLRLRIERRRGFWRCAKSIPACAQPMPRTARWASFTSPAGVSPCRGWLARFKPAPCVRVAASAFSAAWRTA